MDYKQICEVTLPIVREVGAFISSQFGQVTDDQIEAKEKNSLVSYVDKQAEDMLVESLGAILPEAGFITEEETEDVKDRALTWIIDPLDGTTNFLKGIPHFAVSIGLTHQDDLVVGVVLDVMRDECFYAWKSGGAFLNGHPIQVSTTDRLDQAVIGTGFPYDSRRSEELMAIIHQLVTDGRGLRRLGAAALDLAYVASGRLDGYYESALNAWDIAGGALLVKESGGVITDFFGDEHYLTTGLTLASNSLIYRDLQSVVSAHYRR